MSAAARPVPPVDEIVRDLWVHARSFGLIGSDPHRQVYERTEIERALRAALSARTAGVTVEEMQRAYHGARNARGEWNSDVAMEAVHALVAQRGVR